MVNRLIRKIEFILLKYRIHSGEELAQNEQIKLNENEVLRVSREIEPFYSLYIKNVSRADMAASLQLVSVLLKLCRDVAPNKLLDLGSGFSSFVLRYYAKTNTKTEVWSVDDDIQWLNKTKEYLQESALNTEHVVPLQEFIHTNEGHFDIVLLDLNFVEVRKNYIALAIERCKVGGILLFDDVHKPDFMYEVLIQTRNLPIRLYSIRPLSLDNYGRYALLGIKQ
jgi:predicted O-methyltransferase YrrM